MRTPAGLPPAPFLKWAGGKRQLLAHILKAVPAAIETYYEPFVGGGAVFFALAGTERPRFRRAVIADASPDLILCYQTVRADVDGVIAALSRHRYDRAHYYRVRELDPDRLDPAARAARLIYLNRCGFNGLYRVNSQGRFNVPFGRYRNPVICDEPKLRAAALALARADIVCQDFARTLAPATARDFVYLDPPYVPLSRTSSFTAYGRDRFDDGDQRRLADTLRDLGARAVPALLSNSSCATTRRLYRDLPVDRVPVRRSINSVGSGRGAVAELLVKSFEFGDLLPGPGETPNNGQLQTRQRPKKQRPRKPAPKKQRPRASRALGPYRRETRLTPRLRLFETGLNSPTPAAKNNHGRDGNNPDGAGGSF